MMECATSTFAWYSFFPVCTFFFILLTTDQSNDKNTIIVLQGKWCQIQPDFPLNVMIMLANTGNHAIMSPIASLSDYLQEREREREGVVEGDGRGATALAANASLCDLQFFTQDL